MGRMDRLSSDDELIAALRRFGLDKLVQSHPLGLNMPIGEDGAGLSGGQRQMVGLARLTLRDPSVVLLDEPTSGLDEMSERAALQAMAEWATDRTMVVVTHRPQVLPFVQRIIVVDQGKILMDGPREAVLKRLRGESDAAPATRTAGAAAAPMKGKLAVSPRVTVVRHPEAPARARAADERAVGETVGGSVEGSAEGSAEQHHVG